jgi:hypothetical protein
VSHRRFSTPLVFLTANAALIAFVVGRFASVAGTLDRYGVNPWIFLILDVVTVPPYVWGIAQMIRYISGVVSLYRMTVGTLAALIGFAAPYVYTYGAGYRTIPFSIKIIMAVIITVFLVIGPVKTLVKHRNR